MFDPSIVVGDRVRVVDLGDGAWAFAGVYEGSLSFFPGRNIEAVFASAADVVEPGSTDGAQPDAVIESFDDPSMVRDVK